MEKKMENNDENSGPLTLLPVARLNGDRLQRRRSCQNNGENSGPLTSLPESGFLKKNTGIFGENDSIFMCTIVLNSQKRCQYFLCSFKTSDD